MTRINTLAPATFSPKDPAEVVTLGFDFAALAPGLALSAPAVSATVATGTDAAPAALLSGAATIEGTRVLQRVQGGLAGVTYTLRAQVDAADGSRWVLAGLLPVRVA